MKLKTLLQCHCAGGVIYTSDVPKEILENPEDIPATLLAVWGSYRAALLALNTELYKQGAGCENI